MIYEIDSLDEFDNILKDKDHVYMACAGHVGKVVAEYLDLKRIPWEGFLDNNEELQSQMILNKKIIPFDQFKKKDKCFIVIGTVAIADVIERELINNQIPNNSIFRFPNRYLINQMYEALYDTDQYVERIKVLKGIGKKGRCFIIGNGPSLRLEDLEKIGKEFSMATNAIINCFDRTMWRPTCYFVADASTYGGHVKYYGAEKLIKECPFIICSVRSGMHEYAKEHKNVLYFRSTETENASFATDPAELIYDYATTLYFMMQIAMYMDFKELYLLGTDLGFINERKLDGSLIMRGQDNAEAEFLKSEHDPIGIYETEKIILGYRSAKRYADAHGIKIFNASRGGELEVFERIDFDSLF